MRRAFWRTLKELSAPAALALAATLIVATYGDLPTGGWTFILPASTFYSVFSTAAFFTGQVFTARHQEKTEAALTESISRMQALYGAFDAKGNEIVGSVTGGTDSAPYLWGLPDQHPNSDTSPRVTVWGKYSQRDVTMTIQEVPFDPSQPPFISHHILLGNVIFGHRKPLPLDILDGQKGDHRRLFIQFVRLNGTTMQWLHLKTTNGRWSAARRVMAHGQILIEKNDDDYPEQPDWIADRKLWRGELGGKPYNRLA